MREIQLNNGAVALVDEGDYLLVSGYQWYLTPYGYAITGSRRDDGRQTTLPMHRLIMKPTERIVVDHINGDGLDNRRCNLRLASYSQNGQNRRNQQNNKSGFKGVGWSKRNRKWQAYIQINSRQLHLGYFDNPITAALAYDRASAEHHGEFARPNFSRESLPTGNILRPNACDLFAYFSRFV